MASEAETHKMTPLAQSTLAKFWNGPTGPKTIFFYCPLVKWAIVGAGLKDINRPAETISFSQSLTLAATGFIWARYSTQIIPVNYNLMSVNLFVGATGVYQLFRIWHYERQHKKVDAAITSFVQEDRREVLESTGMATKMGFRPV
ncbi:UNVERIFIED_CONTAM: hypothetical protein HDU68_010572 [Siphonaria sp. JEL0065]|nr:hypothetical protein HDU68_010572 [Siphonaria sp. JEL0065]